MAKTISVTNFLPHSASIENEAWVKDSIISYDPATRLLSKTTTGTYVRAKSPDATIVGGGTVRTTLRMKAGTFNKCAISLYNTTRSEGFQSVDVTLVDHYVDISFYQEGFPAGENLNVSIKPGTGSVEAAGDLYVDKIMVEVDSGEGFIKYIDTEATAVTEVLDYYYTSPFKNGVLIGDSIVANAFYAEQINFFCPFGRVANQAVSGSWMETIKTQFDTYVTGSVESVIIEGGVNTIAGVEVNPLVGMKADMKYIIDTALAAKRNVVVLGIIPWAGSTNWTEERQAWTEEFNAWLKNYCESVSAPFVDCYELLRIPGSPYQDPKWESEDNLHPGPAGRYFLAEKTIELFARKKINILNTDTNFKTYWNEGIEFGTEGIDVDHVAVSGDIPFLNNVIGTFGGNLRNSIVGGVAPNIATGKIIVGLNNCFTAAATTGSGTYTDTSTSTLFSTESSVGSDGKIPKASPCINAGAWIAGVNRESQQDPWGNVAYQTPNIGADQGAGGQVTKSTILKRDANGKTVQELAPFDCKTILADTEITGCVKVAPVATATAYFTPNPLNTVSLAAKEQIAVHQNLRFSADTKCLIY